MTVLSDIQIREQLIKREQVENKVAIIKAERTGNNVTFIAEDGCVVTVTPSGYVFHNVADWW